MLVESDIQYLEGKFPTLRGAPSYRWLVDVLYSGYDLYCPEITEEDRQAIVMLYGGVRPEHTLNWTRCELYPVVKVQDLLHRVVDVIGTTTRFEELKVALYAQRCCYDDIPCLDDYMIQKFPYYSEYVGEFRGMESSGFPVVDTINKLGRSEHSLPDYIAGLFRLKNFREIYDYYKVLSTPRSKFEPKLDSIELDITLECNLHCHNCDRSCARAPSSERMSVGQIEKFIRESVTLQRQWDRIRITGGEPTLHPDILLIAGMLLEYRGSYSPKTIIQVVTNGYGPEVMGVLGELVKKESSQPNLIVNSYKRNVNSYHSTVYMAPIDDSAYDGSDFGRGCIIPEWCGISLNRYGYYCCGVGANVARVHGYDIGIKSLQDVNEESLRKQMPTLCRVCGRYKDQFVNIPLVGHVSLDFVLEERVSPTWERAFERYRNEKPQLSGY